MSKSYVNVAMTEEEAKIVAERDDKWTGPRLIVLSFVTIAVAFVILWSAAWRKIGPSFDGDVPLINYVDHTAPER